jgi:hypothetical protein
LRLFLYIITIAVSTTSFCQEKKLVDIRTCFKNIDGVHDIEQLTKMTSNYLDHPVVIAYNCTGKLMLLEYYSNPIEKYRIFKKNTAQLDSIVRANPKLIEIRLLRYVVQKNSPNFLRYNSNIGNDLMLIKSHLFKVNENLQFYIQTILNQFNNDRTGNPS